MFRWKKRPGAKTTPVKCLLCDDEAAVIICARHGCTCSPNKYQPRCMQHLIRAIDSNETFEVVEDFTIPIPGNELTT